jgi:hypothetical protein
MNQIELAADALGSTLGMFNMTIADFSEADMLTRPVPGANHPAWQIGHLIAAETSMGNMIKPGGMPELPAGFADKFSKETASKDDAGFFPKKAVLVDLLTKTHTAFSNLVRTLTPADMDTPTSGRMATMAPTNAHLVGLATGHLMMHMGQLQVLRRKLGKPILF